MKRAWSSLPGNAVDDVLRVLRLITAEGRLEILLLLGERSMDVTALSTELDQAIATTSRHLRMLRESGFVRCTQRRQQRVYRLAPVVLVERGEAAIAVRLDGDASCVVRVSVTDAPRRARPLNGKA